MNITFEQFRKNLVALAMQGRSLLSCESISPAQVEAYKELVDGVLEDSDMRMEDIDQLTAARAIDADEIAASTYSSEDADPLEEEEEEDLAETDLTVDEIVDIELTDEEEEGDSLVPPAEVDVPEPAADTEVQDADNTAIEPAQELEETVEKVEHVVQRVETFIAVTEDSGLSTNDIQEMAASNESFRAIAPLHRLSKTVAKSGSSDLVQAFSTLNAITLRNIGKSIM